MKTCATFGDSITWYDGNVYNWGKECGKTAIGYQHYMREELKIKVNNCGISGWTMPMIIHELMTQGEMIESLDYLTIMSGANDERHGTPVGELKAKGSCFDISTYIGALQAGIEYALSVNADIKIMLFTPIQGWIYAPEGYDEGNPQTVDGRVTEKWASAVKAVAELYSLPVCDLYYESGIDYNNIESRIRYMNDPEPNNGNNLYSLHPSTEGYRLIGKRIVEAFSNAF